ncbi:MAG: fused MFS/spermidine synthase [Pacificimonas sp.]|jgi:hypothetical protein|nr:fused MFS/spermidine synthase [Pacificimonas sp.]
MITDTASARTVAFAPGRGTFIAAVFLGSFLLFLVQPMFARLALPSLGGAPAVWSVALVFYQAVLLAGYLYAHLLTKAGLRIQPLVHITLFAAAALTLPIALEELGGAQRFGPTAWLLLTLAASIGPVFFVVSSQAPLLQSWYAHGAKTAGREPYFLYAASNAGSLLALAVYPLVIEPNVDVDAQKMLWSIGFVLLAVLTALAGRGLSPVAVAAAPTATSEPIAVKTYGYWLALAAVPSGLMISTTSYLTMDIVSGPLLWVIPLGLYLLSFIVAFSESGGVFVRQARFIAPLMLLVIGAYVFVAEGIFAFLFAMAGLVLLFYLALALHGELARTRPEPARLTNFYLTMSAGGVLGGLFPALIAPALFDWVWEHPLLLIGAAALLPATPLLKVWANQLEGRHGPLIVGGLVAISFGLAVIVAVAGSDAVEPAAIGISLAAVLLLGHRLAFAAAFTALLLAVGGWDLLTGDREERQRSFFGVYTVQVDEEAGVRQLLHGTTLHGSQRLGEDALSPVGYYGPGSGAVLALEDAAADAEVGIVGLGIGALACYRQPDQDWTFYEIDPVVVEIAQDERLFSYLPDCTPDAEIIIGDARLSLQEDPARTFDVLVIDAFSSDAIPQHLMTVEAFQLYRARLKPGGKLVVHISNRYLDLAPVVAAIAEEIGMAARLRDNQPGDPLYARSIYVVLADSEAELTAMDSARDWSSMPTRRVEPWRDNFGSIMSVLRY